MTEVASGSRAAGAGGGPRPETIKAIPVRHPWRWVSAVIVLLLVADAVYTVASAVGKDTTGAGPGWYAVWKYLFGNLILQGVVVTIVLTALAMVVGIGLGIALAVMRLSPNPVTSSVSWLYIWFFRGTPVLVQIFFWFNLNTVLRTVGIGIPPDGPLLWSIGTNQLINPFIAVSLGLGLNEAAYMAEIVRAGILSIDEGQVEAASSLGMTRALLLRRIVLPQAMRVIIPPTGNELISMLKNSSLVSIATFTELFYAQQLISARTYQIVPMLIVASIWYLIITSVLTVGQYYVERYYARGSSRNLPSTPVQRFRRMLTAGHAKLPEPAAP